MNGSYQGHAGEGGLQKHSVGGCYPFAVFGHGDPTTYGVLDCSTGQESAPVFTCAGAWELAAGAKRGIDITDLEQCIRYLSLTLGAASC